MVKVESILPRVRSHPINPLHDSHNNKDTKDLNNFCEMLEVCARSIYFNTFSIFQPRSAANTQIVDMQIVESAYLLILFTQTSLRKEKTGDDCLLLGNRSEFSEVLRSTLDKQHSKIYTTTTTAITCGDKHRYLCGGQNKSLSIFKKFCCLLKQKVSAAAKEESNKI